MGEENFRKLILPEASHLGYVTRDFKKAKKDLQRFPALEPFAMMAPDYFNKKYHGESEAFKAQFTFCWVEATDTH